MGDRTCTEPECTRKCLARGLCSTHYGAAYRSGSLPPKLSPPLDRHRLTEVDAERRTALCCLCGPVRIRHRAGRRGPECRTKRYQRSKGYSLSRAERVELSKRQRGRCAICRRGEADAGAFVVDHCHETGRVRGLLCNSCNVGIGFLADNPDRAFRAFAYLATT